MCKYQLYCCSVKGIIDYYGVTDITDENAFPGTPNHHYCNESYQ